MIRRPPRSTLFPYRRSSDLRPCLARNEHHGNSGKRQSGLHWRLLSYRSEEHTSELQSHLNLVCRLLLEKKKNEKTTTVITLPHLVLSLLGCCSVSEMSPASS